jgi:hypothetical protein
MDCHAPDRELTTKKSHCIISLYSFGSFAGSNENTPSRS